MKKSVILSAAFGLVTTSALAGGFDRGGVNVDQLFDDAKVSVNAGVKWVTPQRTLKNVRRANGLTSSKVGVESDYFVPEIGFKFGLTDNLDCLGTYTEPFGIKAEYGTNNAYSQTASEYSIKTRDLGLTCSYSFALQTGQLRAIAGVSYQELNGFQSRQLDLNPFTPALDNNPFTGTPLLGSFQLDDSAFGWRAGVAYEIPEIAFRTSLIYASKYDYDDLKGTVDTTALRTFGISNTGVAPVTASAQIPQSLEFKFQTGINEKTVVFGSVKWQDWSKLGIIPINGVPTPGAPGRFNPTSFDPVYRDGWTVSVGAGRRLTETLSASLAMGWDRGTATVSGTQTDSWTLSGGIKYDFNENVELRLGGLVGLLTDGTSGPTGGDPANNLTYKFDNDFVGAVSISTRLKF